MIFCHVACAVESYRVASDRPGAFGDEILVEGWFLSHPAVRAMEVRYSDGTVFTVHDRERQSDGLVPHYGQSFGAETSRRRFLLVEPVGMRNLDFASAVFHVEDEEGATMSWPIGRLFEGPRPSDFTPDESALVMRFESLGDNCEFGLVQRLVGQERLSFLRYAGVADVFALAEGIAGGLTALDGEGGVEIGQHGNEWIATVPSLRLVFHTGRSVEQISRERIGQEETRKLAFMAQKFMEDCETGEKIFVYRVRRDDRGGDGRGGPDGTRGMEALHAALRRHGPAQLLWVSEAEPGSPPGTLVQLAPGLWRGFLEHLAPLSNAFDHRPRAWLELLAAAEARMLPRERTPEG